MRWLIAAGWLATTTTVVAGEVLETDLHHEDGRYRVYFDVRLAAPAERLRRHLTDYEHYVKNFDSVKESSVLARHPDGVRLRLQLHACVLFFCRTATMVKDVSYGPDGSISARIDPASSDFHEATEHWRIFADGAATRLQYRAELVPKFYVPPLIGPWLIKREIRSSLADGAEKLEAMARE